MSERIHEAELRALADNWRKHLSNSRIAAAIDELLELREALAFYRDEWSYMGGELSATDMLLRDGGETARAALEGK